jgi:hypothetical protein
MQWIVKYLMNINYVPCSKIQMMQSYSKLPTWFGLFGHLLTHCHLVLRPGTVATLHCVCIVMACWIYLVAIILTYHSSETLKWLLTLVESYQYFKRTWCHHFLRLEAVGSSEETYSAVLHNLFCRTAQHILQNCTTYHLRRHSTLQLEIMRTRK